MCDMCMHVFLTNSKHYKLLISTQHVNISQANRIQYKGYDNSFTLLYNIIVSYISLLLIGASLSVPHTSKIFVLSTIHKKLWIKIGELTMAR